MGGPNVPVVANVVGLDPSGPSSLKKGVVSETPTNAWVVCTVRDVPYGPLIWSPSVVDSKRS